MRHFLFIAYKPTRSGIFRNIVALTKIEVTANLVKQTKRFHNRNRRKKVSLHIRLTKDLEESGISNSF